MIKEAIVDVAAGRVLETARAEAVMNVIMDGEATPAQIGAFLTALHCRGDQVTEVVGFARSMRAHVTPVPVARRPLVDIVGTGGGGAPTINVSTAAAIVAAGAGVTIAKHGNRAMTSRCGSADVLLALGIELEQPAASVARCIDTLGIGFMFAPALHPAMKHAAPVRREIGIRTVFNLLGPLTNPAGAECQVTGVPTLPLADLVAEALAALGTQHAFVVHGHAGVDEFSPTGHTYVCEIASGTLTRYELAPGDVGLPEHPLSAVLGGDATENAAAISAVLRGELGARRDFVLFNAAAAIVCAGLAPDLAAGVTVAAQSIDSGAAWAKLEAWRRWPA